MLPFLVNKDVYIILRPAKRRGNSFESSMYVCLYVIR